MVGQGSRVSVGTAVSLSSVTAVAGGLAEGETVGVAVGREGV